MVRSSASTSLRVPHNGGGPGSIAGRRALVVGLGRFGGGVGVTRWLAEQGAIVTVTDQARPEALADSLTSLHDLDLTFHLGGHDLGDLDAVDFVVVNPAVNKDKSEFFHVIQSRSIAWSTEMNLFCERCPAEIIGVTGTFGKSTTCAMLAEVFDKCRPAGTGWTGVYLGGNIGRSLLTDLNSIRPTDLVVLEMSSAQLEDLPRIQWAPPIALITNLSPHHLDRYGEYDRYVATKLNIARDLHCQSHVFVGEIDAEAARMIRRQAVRHEARVTRVQPLDPRADLLVPGEHNQANAACVMAVARHLGIPETEVRGVLRTFRGLPHRLEFVRTIDGVDYYNDSKSTSPVTMMRALTALERPIIAIVGGQKKDVPLEVCAASLAKSCRAVICTGESRATFARAVRGAATTLDRIDAQRPVVAHEVEGLAEGVLLGRNEAKRGDAVLFSPGAPSFDAYANFAERGAHFVELVNVLDARPA